MFKTINSGDFLPLHQFLLRAVSIIASITIKAKKPVIKKVFLFISELLPGCRASSWMFFSPDFFIYSCTLLFFGSSFSPTLLLVLCCSFNSSGSLSEASQKTVIICQCWMNFLNDFLMFSSFVILPLYITRYADLELSNHHFEVHTEQEGNSTMFSNPSVIHAY